MVDHAIGGEPEVDAGEIEGSSTVHDSEDVLPPLAHGDPVDDEPREPAKEMRAEEALEALEVGRLDLVLMMPVEEVLLELDDGLQLLVADLAWIYAADLDLDVLGTLAPARSHMLLGVALPLEALLTAWALLVGRSVRFRIVLPLLPQLLLQMLGVLGDVGIYRPLAIIELKWFIRDLNVFLLIIRDMISLLDLGRLLMHGLPLLQVLDRGGPLILVQLVELFHDDLSLLLPDQLAGLGCCGLNVGLGHHLHRRWIGGQHVVALSQLGALAFVLHGVVVSHLGDDLLLL